MRKGPVIFFYVMVIYMFISFSWWTILLTEKNKETFLEEKKVLQLTNAEAYPTEELLLSSKQYKDLESKYERQRTMILSEGLVMMFLLFAGTVQLYRSFRKEIELNRRQKNFLLSITHELKSPLASTKISLQTLMKKHKLDDEKYFKLINNALNDVERLKILVDNLLLSARIEDHSYKPESGICNLSAITEEIFSKAHEVYGSRKKIFFKIQPSLMVRGDKMALQTIINNIVDNAVKYSPDATEVYGTLIEEKNEIILSVTDEGLGISNAEKEKIFGKFYRIGNEETRTAPGTGIGLFMVKELLLMLNGKIYVKDNEPRGTVFEIHIPKASTKANDPMTE